ncbi:MAG: DUF4199 domain-containing protein [Dokdonella sp.]
MLRKILSYGVVAGLIVGVPMFCLTVWMKDHPPAAYGMVIGYLTMLIALSTVFVAIKRHRDTDLGGVIKFWPAFGLGLGISVVASVLYVLAWEAALAFTQMDFGSAYANMLIEQKKASGVSGEALAKFSAEMERFKVEYANPLYRLPMTFTEIFPVGLLVSLAAAGLLRNSRFLPVRRN